MEQLNPFIRKITMKIIDGLIIVAYYYFYYYYWLFYETQLVIIIIIQYTIKILVKNQNKIKEQRFLSVFHPQTFL